MIGLPLDDSANFAIVKSRHSSNKIFLKHIFALNNYVYSGIYACLMLISRTGTRCIELCPVKPGYAKVW
jgi:hypothetical protein